MVLQINLKRVNIFQILQVLLKLRCSCVLVIPLLRQCIIYFKCGVIKKKRPNGYNGQSRAGPKPGASCWSLTLVQGSKDLGHALLTSKLLARNWIGGGAAGAQTIWNATGGDLLYDALAPGPTHLNFNVS